MSKEYYIKRYKPLTKMYKEYHNILMELKQNPNDKDLINKKIQILKKIKYFLRYEKNKHKWYKGR